MPTHQNDIPLPRHPRDITLEFFGRSRELSNEQCLAIRKLAGLLAEHGAQSGVHYNHIVAGMDADTIGSFAVARQNAKIAFFTNIETLMGHIGYSDGMQAIIGHESGHVRANNFGSLKKVITANAVFHLAESLAQAITQNPDLAKEAIHKEFGSVAALDNMLVRFSSSVLPAVSGLREEKEFFTSTPEKMVRLMEADDPAYQRIRNHLSRLPRGNFMSRIYEGLYIADTHIASYREPKMRSASPVNNTPPSTQLTAKEASLLHTLHTLAEQADDRISIFTEFFSKAEEYFADAHALKTARNLHCVIAPMAQEAIGHMHKEEFTHPSPDKRIRRLQHLAKYSEPPPDNQLRPFGYDDNQHFQRLGLPPIFAEHLPPDSTTPEQKRWRQQVSASRGPGMKERE